MIYGQPQPDDAIDQGDIVDGCPLFALAGFDRNDLNSLEIGHAFCRVVVLTQTCDLANAKASEAVVAVVLDAQNLVDRQLLKVADIKGPIRAGRVFG